MKNFNLENNDEIKTISTTNTKEKSGITFVNNNELCVINNDYHTLVITEDDIQKENSIILPMIKTSVNSNNSLIINDLQGNIYNKSKNYLEKNGYKVNVINLDDPTLGDTFNPFELPYNLYKEGLKDKAQTIIEEICYYLLYEKSDNNSDPFWNITASNFFTGLVLYSFENYSQKDITLQNIYNLSQEITSEMFDKKSNIYTYLSGTLLAAPDTKASIISVFLQKINRYICKDNIKKLMKKTSFDFKNISNIKQVLFIIQGTSNISNNLSPLIISEAYHSINNYGSKTNTNVLINDFDLLLPMKNICKIISNSKKINFTVFIKNFNSFNRLYKEEANILKLYFQNILFLFSNDIDTLNEISKMCGEINNKSIADINTLRSLDELSGIILIPRKLPLKIQLIKDIEL